MGHLTYTESKKVANYRLYRCRRYLRTRI